MTSRCLEPHCLMMATGKSKRCADHKRMHAIKLRLAARERAQDRLDAKLAEAEKLLRNHGFHVEYTGRCVPEAFPS